MAVSRIDEMTVGDLKAVNAVLAKYHLSLESLMGESSKAPASKAAKTTKKGGGKRGKAAVRYRNKKTKDKWTGRGGPIKWLKAEMDAGHHPDQFLLKGMEHSKAALNYWENRSKPVAAKKATPKKMAGKKAAKKKATKKAAAKK